MYRLLKKLWHRLREQLLGDYDSPISGHSAEWPNDGPSSELEACESTILYVLPYKWSLYYALTKKQWRDFRERHKKLYPEWDHCKRPKRCKAYTLDEQWQYDEATHQDLPRCRVHL